MSASRHGGRPARRKTTCDGRPGSTDDYVREYPWYALGAGAVLGFALGILVSRSRD